MARLRPSAARRTVHASRAASIRESAPVPLRSRWRASHPRAGADWSDLPLGSVTGSGVQVVGHLSADTIVRVLPGGSQLDRWATIQAGGIPDDEDIPALPSAESLDERLAAELEDVFAEARARDAGIREHAEEQAASLRHFAEQQEARAVGARAAHMEAQAEDARAEARRFEQQAAALLEASAEQVREERAAAVQRIRAEVAALKAEREEAVQALRAGLHREVEAYAQDYFERDAFQLESFEII